MKQKKSDSSNWDLFLEVEKEETELMLSDFSPKFAY